MTKAVFYHAGYSVCVSAEQQLLSQDVQVDVVHLGEKPARLAEAEKNGVQSVPVLVVDGQVLHINYGAALADLKA
ncbi:glutaredoxin family protein [Serratia sp. NA_112.1]|uniref:glutaredoxin family protein n=1 Tax=unclassified Serratia (in: enterobacteria) TaxID=2647522 RepID=UPI004046E721